MITSPSNPRVTAARKLQQRRARAAARLFLVEGPHAVEAAAAVTTIQELFLTPSMAARESGLVQTIASAGATVTVVSDSVLATLADTVSPQGIVAVVHWPTVELAELLTRRPRLSVLLDHVNDPGNAGTIVRTADAAGADLVVTSTGSADLSAPKTVRASAGSIFHLPLIKDARSAEVIADFQAGGVRVIAAAAGGDVDLDAVTDDGVLVEPTLWLFGNEATGLPSELLSQADVVVRIPIYGRAESLNLAAAAAICLYATARAQRHGRGKLP